MSFILVKLQQALSRARGALHQQALAIDSDALLPRTMSLMLTRASCRALSVSSCFPCN